MISLGQPNFSIIFPKSSLLTVPKALERSTKVPKKSLLFLAFFLELACSEYHVGNSTFCAETTLAFWEETLSKMFDEGVEQDAGQDLASKAKDRNTLVIITRLAIAFPLDYAGIF